MESENIQTEVNLNIEVGFTFRNLPQFEEDLMKMCKSKFVQFYKKDARTIEAALKKNVTRYLNPVLKFYSIRWCCIHGGRRYQGRGKGLRKTATLRREDLCPAFIQIRITESGHDFHVTGVCYTHNHLVAEELFKQLPHNRRLPDDVKTDIKTLLAMKADMKLRRRDLEKRRNQRATLKDLRNLVQSSQSDFKPDSKCIPNDIQLVTNLIQTQFGASCHVLIDEDDLFKGLFFSSEEMISTLIAYPEIFFLDATFKLPQMNASVYIVLNVDGNGDSNIVAVGIIKSDEAEILEWFLRIFKDSLPHETLTEITNVVTDTDFPGRDILQTNFPSANLQICVLGVLEVFKREITRDRFIVSSSTKDEIIFLLQNLVYSKTEKDFYDLIHQIKKRSKMVFDYLIDNWIDIKQKWCPFLGNKSKNFMKSANRRLEEVNSKLKIVLDESTSLEEFVNHLIIIKDWLERERNIRLVTALNKRRASIYTLNDFEYKYQKLLTPYAFERLKPQFSFQDYNMVLSPKQNIKLYAVTYKNYQLQTTSNSCTCYFHNSMGLPCKHIFFVRQYLNLSLFDPALVLDRWKMSYLLENSHFLHHRDNEVPDASNIATTVHVEKNPEACNEEQMTCEEKYRKTFIKAKLVATLASDLREDKYRYINGILDELIQDLQKDRSNFVESAYSLIEGTTENLKCDRESSDPPSLQLQEVDEDIVKNKSYTIGDTGNEDESEVNGDTGKEVYIFIVEGSSPQNTDGENYENSDLENDLENYENSYLETDEEYYGNSDLEADGENYEDSDVEFDGILPTTKRRRRSQGDSGNEKPQVMNNK